MKTIYSKNTHSALRNCHCFKSSFISRFAAIVSLCSLAILLTANGQTCVSPPSGLLSWWRAETNAFDHFGVNNGTLAGNTTYATGWVGQAFSFDGNGDAVRVGSPTNLQLQDFTIEAWIKRSSTSISSQVTPDASFFGYGHAGYGFGMWSDGSLFLTKWDTDNVTTTPVVTDTNFHHVAVTKSGTAVTFYVDGVSVAVLSYDTIFIFSTTAAIGAQGDNLNCSFYGLIDELSIYNRALADFEIQGIYNAGNAGKCASPVGPSIVSQPMSQTVFAGANVSFSVTANGTPPLFYQWLRNTTNLPGATSSSLNLTNVQIADGGTYAVIVSNSVGPVTSSDAVLTVNPPPPCSPPPTGLVSWWPGENNTNDVAGGNSGVLLGGAGYTNGVVGRAFRFDGTSGHLRVADRPSLHFTNGLTIETWINPITVGNGPGIISKWAAIGGAASSQLSYGLALAGDGRAYLLVSSNGVASGDQQVDSTDVVTPGQWTHVAGTYDGTILRIYLNGNLEGQTAFNGGIFPGTNDLAIGAVVGGLAAGQFIAHFNGQIDEPSMYNRALSDSEIQAIYNASISGKCGIAPAILAQPQGQRVKPGTNVTFTVSARGTALSYHWRLEGADLAGATNSSLVLSNVQPTMAGNYSVRVTNSLGTATSSNAMLKVDVVFAFGNGQPLTNSMASFSGPVTIQLTNVYTNGYIFYTLDGSEPSFYSAQYTAPFVVTQAVVLRALGYNSDFFQSGQLDPVTILIPPSYTLTTNTAGGGSVSLNPSGGYYLSNTIVTVTATPAGGWTFLQWAGDLTGTGATNTVTMSRNKFVQAIFGTTLSTTVAGGGSVVLNPSGGIYPYGTIVWLSAIPQPGNVFGLWGNAGSGNVNPLSFGVTNPNPTISSLFGPVSGGQAALTVVPVGSGRISVNPRANSYTLNTTVTITATADSGQSFTGWSGDASGMQNPLSVTMSANKLIYANFTHGSSLSTRASYEGAKPEGFVFTLKGDYGAKYEIDGSTNLVTWTNLSTVTDMYGTMQFTDSGATNLSRRFYRAVLLP